MRFLVVAIVTLALMPGLIGTACSAGYQVVGKEECDCSSLVARGVYPDTLNKLHQTLYFPTVISAVDRLAMDIKSIVTHFIVGSTPESPESEASKEETKIAPEKSALHKDEKVGKEEKTKESSHTKKDKKATQSNKSKSKGKKRIKIPSSH